MGLEEKYFSLIFLILKRANISELCLVPNYGGSISRVYEGRAYKLKHARRQRKYWISSKVCSRKWNIFCKTEQKKLSFR
ncbi:hypothetical protein T09_9966 [Trichinella sp. T9]|nr:hypothetical protein T09_9966 [Trichinella sp. T9]